MKLSIVLDYLRNKILSSYSYNAKPNAQSNSISVRFASGI